MKSVKIGSLLSLTLLSSFAYAQEVPAAPPADAPPSEAAAVDNAPEATSEANNVSTPVEETPVAAVSEDNSAAVPADGSFEFDLRGGFALPVGGEDIKGVKSSDLSMGNIPVRLGLGWRFNRSFYAGAFGSIGWGLAPSDAAKSKEFTDIKAMILPMAFGLEAHYHIMPTASFDPWLGLGVGYEMNSMSAEQATMKISSVMSGFMANVQLGADYRLNSSVGLGPFVSFSGGQYMSQTSTAGGISASSDLKDTRSIHMNLTAGLRGTFNL